MEVPPRTPNEESFPTSSVSVVNERVDGTRMRKTPERRRTTVLPNKGPEVTRRNLPLSEEGPRGLLVPSYIYSPSTTVGTLEILHLRGTTIDGGDSGV